MRMKNWKHETKNRKPYMWGDNKILRPDAFGEMECVRYNRRSGKKNTSFMREV